MKTKSSFILIVAALFILSCATAGPKSAPLFGDSQAILTCQYHLDNLYDYDETFPLTPAVEQTVVSGIQYYLEDIYEYDDAFLVTQPVIRQAPDYFAILSKFDEDLFSTIEPVPSQIFISGIQYSLEDIYDYDILFMIQPMIKQALVSEIQYYLADIYDYDSASFVAENETPFFLAGSVPKQTADSKNIADYFAILSIFDEDLFSTTEPVPSQIFISGIQYHLDDIYDYAEPYVFTKISETN